MVNQEEKVAVKKSSILGSRLLTLIWILVGAIGCYLINPLYGWLHLIFGAVSV